MSEDESHTHLLGPRSGAPPAGFFCGLRTLAFRRFADSVYIGKVLGSAGCQFRGYQVITGKKARLQSACRVRDIFNALGPCSAKVNPGYFGENVNPDRGAAHAKERAGCGEVARGYAQGEAP